MQSSRSQASPFLRRSPRGRGSNGLEVSAAAERSRNLQQRRNAGCVIPGAVVNGIAVDRFTDTHVIAVRRIHDILALQRRVQARKNSCNVRTGNLARPAHRVKPNLKRQRKTLRLGIFCVLQYRLRGNIVKGKRLQVYPGSDSNPFARRSSNVRLFRDSSLSLMESCRPNAPHGFPEKLKWHWGCSSQAILFFSSAAGFFLQPRAQSKAPDSAPLTLPDRQ